MLGAPSNALLYKELETTQRELAALREENAALRRGAAAGPVQ
jgi:hypothetical protein